MQMSILRRLAVILSFFTMLMVSHGAHAQANTPNTPVFNMAQTISDGAQSTTMAFSGLALMTGNLDAQSFFPPGKVADYTGFQYLRDNDPDNMGHNTSFLTRVANNVIYILNDSQLAKLSALAVSQQSQVDLYGYKRYPLMQAFRRLIDGNIPSGSSGLNLNAVKAASRALYLIDGQISFDRAVLYASIINSLDATQKANLAAMKGKGWSSWPDITDAQINSKMFGLAQGSKVAVMTYASDIYSWYAGSLEADVYFCPERHGTYYGGFYIKDAPAVGHEGYSIDEQMTATAGAALIDTSKGYVTQDQATTMYSLVATQKDNLNSIVSTRTQIATLLRTLLNAATSADSIKAQVLALSETYGDLDGANNYHYATTFAQVYKTLNAYQKTRLAALRMSMMSGKYADGTVFDFSVAITPFLYSAVLTDAQIAPYISDAVTNPLFFEPASSSLTVPGAPTSALAMAGNAQATVSFSAPTSDGGLPIVSYSVTSTPGGITKAGAASPITVTGLSNGTSYTFTVAAANALGTGPSSGASNSATPTATVTVPSVPTILATSTGNGSAILYFSAPSSNGGSDITGYKANCGTIVVSSTSSPISVAPLTNGTTYACTVKAGNVIGYSGPSAAVNVTPNAAAPGPVSSAGLYDGIYQWSPGNYLSIHQRGARIIATIYLNADGSFSFNSPDGHILPVPQLDIFDLLNGSISGSRATISGTRFHRACNVSYNFAFSDNGDISVTKTAVSNTAAADLAGISCAAITEPMGVVMVVPKILF